MENTPAPSGQPEPRQQAEPPLPSIERHTHLPGDLSGLSAQIYPQLVPSSTSPTPNPTPASALPDGGGITRNPFKNIGRGFMKFAKTNLLKLIVYSILFIAGYVGLILLFGVLLSASGSVSLGGLTTVSIGLYIFLFLMLSGYMLISSNLLLEGVRGHRVRISNSLWPIKKAWIPLIYEIVYFIIAFLLFWLLIGAVFSGTVPGFAVALSYIVAIIFTVYLLLKWSFTFFAIIDYPDSGPINSLSRSNELTKGHRLSILVYWALAFGAGLILGFIAGSGSSSNTNIYNTQASSSYSATEFIIGLLTAIISLLTACGLAELYRQIKDGQGDMPAPQPPAFTPAPINSVPPTPPPQ